MTCYAAVDGSVGGCSFSGKKTRGYEEHSSQDLVGAGCAGLLLFGVAQGFQDRRHPELAPGW